jgi:hypothetical protein
MGGVGAGIKQWLIGTLPESPSKVINLTWKQIKKDARWVGGGGLGESRVGIEADKYRQ